MILLILIIGHYRSFLKLRTSLLFITLPLLFLKHILIKGLLRTHDTIFANLLLLRRLHHPVILLLTLLRTLVLGLQPFAPIPNPSCPLSKPRFGFRRINFGLIDFLFWFACVLFAFENIHDSFRHLLFFLSQGGCFEIGLPLLGYLFDLTHKDVLEVLLIVRALQVAVHVGLVQLGVQFFPDLKGLVLLAVDDGAAELGPGFGALLALFEYFGVHGFFEALEFFFIIIPRHQKVATRAPIVLQGHPLHPRLVVIRFPTRRHILHANLAVHHEVPDVVRPEHVLVDAAPLQGHYHVHEL